jgi:hypothetical protein
MMIPYAFNTSEALYVTSATTVTDPDMRVAEKVPDWPKKDWHAIVDMKRTF